MNRHEIVERLTEIGGVAVVRLGDAGKVAKVAEALAAGGLPALEITMTTPNAIEVIRELTRNGAPEWMIGVGSVLDRETAERAVAAGAKYVVSPVFKPEVVEAAHELNVPAMPGAFTPTEIQAAHEAGADIVKVFPAECVGTAFFKAVLAPMPHLRLMPTGGVTPENAGEWLRAGAVAVGIGSALLVKKAIDSDDWARLTENARTMRAGIDAARQK